MHYFRPSLGSDDSFAAWDSQLAQAAEEPWLKQLARADLRPIFLKYYSDVGALPRGARRALQRKLTASREIAVPAAWRLKLAGSIAGTALLLALAHASQAATITVNTNIARLIPGDQKCSLVEAILNANADSDVSGGDCAAGSGPDIIVLPSASAHVAPGIYDTTYGNTRLPAITSPITIEGNGGTIQGTKKGGAARLIAVKTSGDLTLQAVTISAGAEVKGGAIYNAGHLTIADSSFISNVAFNGGALFNAHGDVTIDESTFSKNTGYYGGAIFNDHGMMTLQHTTITGNKGARGGGIRNFYGSVDIEDSLLTKNTAVFGGGIYGRNGQISIEETTISANTAHFSAGAILNESGSLDIQSSTISGNKSAAGTGGISNARGPLVLENSTVSRNVGRNVGAMYGESMTLKNSTITGNSAKRIGGVYNFRLELLLIQTIVSGNKGAVAPEILNFASNAATVAADHSNLFGTNGNPGVGGFSPGASDIVPPGAITTILAPLADTGGPTLTHALVPGSPAIDAAPVDANCPATDQRGVSRPQGAQCDIGAFEK